MNRLTSTELDYFFSITHNEDFINTRERESYNENVDNALSFYINLRSEISDAKGSLYKLKKEFDSLQKKDLESIRSSGAAPIIDCYKDLA